MLNRLSFIDDHTSIPGMIIDLDARIGPGCVDILAIPMDFDVMTIVYL